MQGKSKGTQLHVKHCQKLKFFASEFQNSPDLNPDGEDRFSTDQQAIVSLEKVWLFFIRKPTPKDTAFCAYIDIYY